MEIIVNLLATRSELIQEVRLTTFSCYVVPTCILPGIVVCVLFAGRVQGYVPPYRVTCYSAIDVCSGVIG